MKKYLVFTTVLVLIFYMMLFNSINFIEDNNSKEINIQNQEYDQINQIKLSKKMNPIFINGNNSFTSDNGVVSGSGSPNNPYIIKDLYINTSNNEFCIFINNTNAYFRIINCTLINSNPSDEISTIKLNNVSNGFIYSNNISLAPIKLNSSDNNIITNNTIYNDSYISLKSSHYNTIFNNTIIDSFYSIFLKDSNHTKIIENNVIDCSYGINLIRSCKNNLTANNITNCDLGVSIWEKSHFNRIEYNIIYNYSNEDWIEIGPDCVGNIKEGNIYKNPNGNGNGPPQPPSADDDDDDDDDDEGIEEIFLIPILISIIAAALVSTIALITHRKLRKKKQEEIKKKLDKLPPIPKY